MIPVSLNVSGGVGKNTIMCIQLRNEFYFSEVYRSVYYLWSRTKWMTPEGVRINFASDPM